MKPTKLTHDEVLVVDKIIYEAKITDFELYSTSTGRQYFWDSENSEKLNIKDGLQFICDAACYGFDFALEFGLTQQEIDTWNAMIDRFGLSDEFKAEDFKEREILRVKESTRKQSMNWSEADEGEPSEDEVINDLEVVYRQLEKVKAKLDQCHDVELREKYMRPISDFMNWLDYEI